ncbi:hypothetical protein ASPWEDRAFT_37766 [Aspergillus wentii DTO 134E9]|uniref:Enoyl-CoA hydratase n=1 Tax=Aspergillus wentii DTO 134E9 TaxID=1073089 RepID=A0A1L9RYB4_ASPWE|nr:uncharacterized protein ASPWEDRAFT_37766 [Aspergillus wentii DTO 134E9]OJJ39895.1 hypothetical protein ASPWEDRAFT_37766 [Aspergillus wentii DTO 134E9]
MSISLPSSYETLDTTHIKVSHHPAGSPTVTPVVVVTLNRPEKQNAYTEQMGSSLQHVFQLFDVDSRVKVIVLTGAGKTFCAGADLEIGFNGVRGRIMDHRDSGGRITLAIHRCRKPTIFAMQGSAVGVGMTMSLPATIRIAHEKSKYGFVFGRRGITMESASSYFLPRLIGYSRAMYLVSTGAVLPPTSKHFGSLFSETLPEASQVLPRALALATDMAENVSPLASSLNRDLMWRGPDSPEEAHLLDSGILLHMFQGRDQREGVAAFLEKRKAKFQANFDEDAPVIYPWWKETHIDARPKAARASKL